MEAADFVQIVIGGAEQDALAALERHPGLAAARNEQGVSVVCLAVYRGSRELAAMLARLRDRLDLFEATCVGDVEHVRILLDEDSSAVSAVSPDGFSALGYAAFFGHPEIGRELLARGADVNAPSRNVMRVHPINSAAAHANEATALALLTLLVNAGADVNARQHGGFTALHQAAHRGSVPMLRLLLERGADPALRTDEGASALDLSRAKGHREAARLLGSE